MSVAILVDTFPRWSERFIARELKELQRRGIAFTIYCMKAGDESCERDAEFANLIPRRVILPSCFLPSFARELGMDAPARERLRLVEDALGPMAFRQIGCANSLAKIIRDNRHTMIYAHFASLPSTLGWLAAEALKLPLVLSVHARDVFVEPQLLHEKMSCAQAIFTCNRKAANYLKSSSGDATVEKKIILMPHGLPLERYEFSARREPGLERKTFKFLAAGRFVPKKGFDILIEAMARPELRDAEIDLTIAGDGPERGKFVKQIEKLKMAERISLPGRMLDAELQRCFAIADAFVAPSINTDEGDSDGLPNVILEAFALGLPVIGTDAGSLSDVLNDETGFVAKMQPGHKLAAQDIALAIRSFLDQPAFARKKAKAARAVIEARFDIRKTIQPLVAELTAS